HALTYGHADAPFTPRASTRAIDLARLPALSGRTVRWPAARVRTSDGLRSARGPPMSEDRTGPVRKSHVFNVTVLVAGLVALLVLLQTIDWSAMGNEVRHVGSWFAIIAAIDFASIACDAFGIHGFLRVHVPDVSYPRVFAAEASGLGINRLTPGNSLGEPVK